MSATRLYTATAFVMMMALVTVGVLTVPVIVGSLNQPAAASPLNTDDARLIQRRGEWAAGAAVTDPEIVRFVVYSNGLAEQARLAQRQGEWNAGASSPAEMDVENARLAWRANH